MKNLNKYLRILLHLSFWLGLIIVFQFQNPDSVESDYYHFLSILLVLSAVVYFNLYFLFPRYFNTKKTFWYVGYLLLTVSVGALYLTLMLINPNESSQLSSFLQNYLNILFFVLVTSGLKFYRDNNRMQIQIKNLENIQLRTELSMLKAQINPHFLFNSLNNLYGLVLKNENQIAAKNILNLSELMRYILDSSTRKEVSLKEEIRFINNYLEIEKIRLSSKLNIQFETSLNNEDISVPPLLLIPMIENAFKHGIAHHTTEGYAHFSLSVQDNELFFEAKNSLSGQPMEDNRKSGKGLANLRRRLEISFPKKHTLNIEKDAKSFTIVLTVKL